MTVKGKKAYKIYLDESNIDIIRFHLKSKKNQGGLSHLLDKLIEKIVFAIKQKCKTSEPSRLSSSTIYRILMNTIREDTGRKTL